MVVLLLAFYDIVNVIIQIVGDSTQRTLNSRDNKQVEFRVIKDVVSLDNPFPPKYTILDFSFQHSLSLSLSLSFIYLSIYLSSTL